MLDLIAGFVAGSVAETVADEIGLTSVAREVTGAVVDAIFDPIVGPPASQTQTRSCAPRSRPARPRGTLLVCADGTLSYWSEPGKRTVCITDIERFDKKSKKLLKEHGSIENIFKKSIGQLIIGNENKIVIHPAKSGYFNRIDLYMPSSTNTRLRTLAMARAIAVTYTYNLKKTGTLPLLIKDYALDPYQVDQFAACLLMPYKKDIKSLISGIPSRASQIGTLAQRYNVAEDWASLRLKILEL